MFALSGQQNCKTHQSSVASGQNAGALKSLASARSTFQGSALQRQAGLESRCCSRQTHRIGKFFLFLVIIVQNTLFLLQLQ
jgi:hypothetical protein